MTELSKDTILSIKSGNIKAFEQLLFAYEKPIYFYLLRHLPSADDAQDLTQETFIKVYKNLSKIDQEKSIKSWLFTIATNTLYDHLRHKKSHPEQLIIDDEDSGFETIDESDTYKLLEDQIDIDKLLSSIKPEYRIVVDLYYFQGLPYDEIAKSLELPVNTVKTHLRRAKIELSSVLKEQSL